MLNILRPPRHGAFSVTRCSLRALCASSSSSTLSPPISVPAVGINTKLIPGKTGVYKEYMDLVSNDKLQYDEHQFKVIKTLERVQQGIHNSAGNTQNEDSPGGMISRGVYIYGEVGTGKTMMMDLFLKSTKLSKKRVHFHKFMLNVHKIIHEYKQGLLQKYGREKNLNMDPDRDPILHCASVIRESAQLLCFDEFQVTDIADAIIMTKLFGELWRQGTILVATSNRPPSSLYQGGLNRSYFLPFIDELEFRCLVRHLKSPIDYRTLLSTKLPDAYLTPVNDETTRQLHDMFLADESTRTEVAVPVLVPVMMGRELTVQARGRVCYVTFQDMCERNRGAADYSALARHMDVIYLQGVPVLSVIVHDKARRFITFIDEVYDAGKRLVWTSERDPEMLFQFLTPTDMKDADFGTDHSWANLEAVRGESGGQLGASEPQHSIRGREGAVVEKFEKDGGFVSMRFQEASRSSEVSFHDPLRAQEEEAGASSEEKEIKLLEGELASIQELSFAFKRAGSRLAEMSSRDYLQASQAAAATEDVKETTEEAKQAS